MRSDLVALRGLVAERLDKRLGAGHIRAIVGATGISARLPAGVGPRGGARVRHLIRTTSLSLGPLRLSVRASVSVSVSVTPKAERSSRQLLVRQRMAVASLVLVAALVGVFVGLVVANGSNIGSRNGQARVGTVALPPLVRYTGRPPTGYVVTFSYRAPSARSVLIQGEWYFSNPTLTTAISSQGLLPSQWKSGDVATGWPAPSTPDGWPIVSMNKNPNTGVWSYATPLPSGYYNYGFYVGCSLSTALSNPSETVGCHDPEVSDPSNPPWNDRRGVSTGSVDGRSQVYVPADPAFDKVNDSWEAPTSPMGQLRDVSYRPVAGASAPGRKNVNFLAIYTPPGYDAHRRTPYPTLYLSPGAGLNEVDWSTQGDAANIVDNLIDRHRIKPTVVVMTNTDCPAGPKVCGATITPKAYERDVLRAVIPYVQAHYDVSREPSKRAFAGFSAGGWAAGSLLVDDTTAFGSYGLFSPCPEAVPTPRAAAVAAMSRVRVLVGGGLEDPMCHPFAVDDLAVLQRGHVGAVSEFFYGGHSFDVWRRLLRDFLTRVAFKAGRG